MPIAQEHEQQHPQQQPHDLIEDLEQWAHVPQDETGRRAILSGALLGAISIAALVAGILGEPMWPAALGAAFVIGGVAELVDAVEERETRSGRHIGWVGALPLVVGMFFLIQLGMPDRVNVAAVALYLVVSGIIRAAFGLFDHYGRWTWDVAYGAGVFVLGGALWFTLDSATPALVWYAIAVELLLRAVSTVGRDFALRRALLETQPTVH